MVSKPWCERPRSRARGVAPRLNMWVVHTTACVSPTRDVARRLWMKLRRPGDGDLRGTLQTGYTGNLSSNDSVSLAGQPLHLHTIS